MTHVPDEGLDNIGQGQDHVAADQDPEAADVGKRSVEKIRTKPNARTSGGTATVSRQTIRATASTPRDVAW
jgi:hypothetical protein